MTPFQEHIYALLVRPMTYDELLRALAARLGRSLQQTAGSLANALTAMYRRRLIIRGEPDGKWRHTK